MEKIWQIIVSVVQMAQYRDPASFFEVSFALVSCLTCNFGCSPAFSCLFRCLEHKANYGLINNISWNKQAHVLVNEMVQFLWKKSLCSWLFEQSFEGKLLQKINEQDAFASIIQKAV